MQLIAFLIHIFTSKNEHSLHSPFLFNFYSNTVLRKPKYIDNQDIEEIREQFKKNDTLINFTDFGAGSKQFKKYHPVKISRIAYTSEKSFKWQFLFFKIIQNYFKNALILELGTSLGITTSYLSLASSNNWIYTFEGCPEIARLAQSTFDKQQINNIKLIEGNIDSTLPKFLKRIDKVDFVLFDANHQYEPTLRYFELCLSKAHENSIFIFDDIYWSKEMQAAWEEIKNHESVTATFDFYHIGIVFFRKTLNNQHFKLKF